MNLFKNALNYSSRLINRDIYLYLFHLNKFIFLNPRKSNSTKKIEEKLAIYTDNINEKIIKNKDKYINININLMYTKENFMNIFDFIKMQNLLFAGDIIEGILIMIFSMGLETDKDNCFGKYLFNNMNRFVSLKHNDLAKWFKKEKFRKNEDIEAIEALITVEEYDSNDKKRIEKKETIKEKYSEKDSIFYNLLLEINKDKYKSVYLDENNTKAKWYIHRGVFKSQKRLNRIYKEIIKKCNNRQNVSIDKDIFDNSLQRVISDIYSENSVIQSPLNVLKAFFISVYIYYQNKHSQLIKYAEPNEDNQDNENENEDNDEKYVCKDPIPYEYDLKGAYIEGKFANIIFAPIRIEPRVSRINISQNNFRERGFFEISKSLIFNNYLSYFDFNVSLLKSYYLEFLNFGLGLFDNYSIKELNLSYNYIREDCDSYLARMLSHLKGIKTISLSTNDLKRGASSFFILLKRLYRERKINLENLYLNKCTLDDASFYELGELLKSKYCKLKKLYLSQNMKSSNVKFLKKLKKNRSLIEFNFSKSNISNHDLEDINKIISNTPIRHLYLFKNKITDFNITIKTIYRTKLMKDKNEIDDNVMCNDDSILINLDLSNSDIWIKNKQQVILIKKIIDETNLSCLDISHILYGPNPEKKVVEQSNESYRNYIDNNIKAPLENYDLEYKNLIKNKIPIEIDIKKLEPENYKAFNDFDEELNIKIDEITNQKDAQYDVYLKKSAIEIINKIKTEAKYENIKKKANLDNKENYKNFFYTLVNYLKLISSKKRLTQINDKLDKKKLIIV